jgi:alpha-tubulin suppressor-like RCC1 family protein
MISAGSSHSMALRADGTVVAWGYNGSGQCDVPPGLSGIVSISAGPNASFALRSDGTVVGWGSDSSIADHFSDVKSISASNISHSLIGLKADGTIVQGGDYTPPPYPLSGIIKVANFYQTYLALKDDRTVLAWGEGNSVPRGLSGVSAIAAEIDHAIALKKAP